MNTSIPIKSPDPAQGMLGAQSKRNREGPQAIDVRALCGVDLGHRRAGRWIPTLALLRCRAVIAVIRLYSLANDKLRFPVDLQIRPAEIFAEHPQAESLQAADQQYRDNQ
jgi:hypothetical protein